MFHLRSPRLALLAAPFACWIAASSQAVDFNAVQTLQGGLGNVSVIVFGPEDPDPASAADGCVYAGGTFSGEIHRICFDATKTVATSDVVLEINGGSGVNIVGGITFDPGSDPAGTMILYVSYADDNNSPFTGKIARATSSDGGASWSFDDGLGGSVEDGESFIRGLGRSSFDHQLFGIDFVDGCLLISQGNNSNAGYDPAHAESFRSSSIQRACFNLPSGLVDPAYDRDCGGGNTQEACDLEIAASGVRNAVGLTLHSNGEVYWTDNDPSPNFRDDCGNNANTFGCPCQDVLVEPGDEFNRFIEGVYYGSPNPAIANPAALQCQGGTDGGDACSVDADCAGGGTCQDLSALCTDPLCDEDVQCIYSGAGQDPLNPAAPEFNASLDPNGLFEPPLFNDGQMDGMSEYRTPLDWDDLLLGSFCSAWNGDVIMTPAGGTPFKRARVSADGLSATFEGTGNLGGLSGLGVAVGPDGTIYAATLGGGSVTYKVPIEQGVSGDSNFFLQCSPGFVCDEATDTCVLPEPGALPGLMAGAGMLWSLARRRSRRPRRPAP